jgi:pimeloyl-ACP methyl ester carboxylesterase
MTPDVRRTPRPAGRRRHPARKLGLALLVLGLLASVLTQAPPTPAQAQTARPILMVTGFGQDASGTEETWGDLLASQTRLPDDQVRVVELSGFIPGTDSMEESANEILLAINDLYEDYDTPIDIVAISQGSPAARRTLARYPSSQSRVAGFISFSGANIGIARNHPDPTWAAMLNACSTGGIVWPVCAQMVYPSEPGDTEWLRRLNGIIPAGDPTPGDIRYYYIYSERTTSNPPENEGLLAYDWRTPLPGAEDMSAQRACPTNPNRFAPHAGWYDTGGPELEPDAVMHELALDALNRRLLVIDNPATTCADHPGWPSG